MNGELVQNVKRISTTERGAERVSRSIGIPNDIDEVIRWCQLKVLDPNADIEHVGKNWYVRVHGYEITINISTYNIITVH